MFDMSDYHWHGMHKEGKENGQTQTSKGHIMLNNPDILTGISHEMRTQMNAIVAFSFLMNSRESGETERREFSNYIINSCDHLISLFDNFLDSAIIDTGNSTNDLRNCNLNDLLETQVSEFRSLMGRFDHKSVELILEDRCIKNGNVYIDIDKVSRVIRNLFLNALENTQSGYIRIGYKIETDSVVFHVLDSGQGFQKSSLILCVKPGDRMSISSSDTHSAVSLILARKLVGLMNGEIWIEKNGVSGTGVYFSLPVKEPASKPGSFSHEIRTRMAI